MDIFGNIPEKQSNNEKRLEAAIAQYSLKDALSWWDQYLTDSWILWCERQYRRDNPRNQEWPFYTDFRICVVSYDFEKMLRDVWEDPTTDINLEADGDYHAGMSERERDYFKDASCLLDVPTMRFGPQRIFKEAGICVAEAVRLLLLLHGRKLGKASLFNECKKGYRFAPVKRQQHKTECESFLSSTQRGTLENLLRGLCGHESDFHFW